jgi:hypothetical protein
MFAPTSQKIIPVNNAKIFHRYVRPITSLVNLVTIIKLLKVDHLLVGEVDPLTTDLRVSDTDQAKTISFLIKAIIQNEESRDQLYQEVQESLQGQNLYATVFISEDQTQRSNTLVLAIGPADNKITYVSVTEGLLKNAARYIMEV